MFVEFIGLPGSGKSTLIKSLRRLSAGADKVAVPLSQLANQVLAAKKSHKGYLRRKADRGQFFGTFSFAHQYPEVFRIAFENTLRDTPGQLDFLDLLGQYYFAAQAQDKSQLVLVDEGLLHRGSAAFLNPGAFSDLNHYLNHIPSCEVVVWIDLDIETAIARSQQRPKGLPKLYRKFTEDQLIRKYQRLQTLHQTCLAHQEQAGAKILRLDSRNPLEENTSYLYDTLVKISNSLPAQV